MKHYHNTFNDRIQAKSVAQQRYAKLNKEEKRPLSEDVAKLSQGLKKDCKAAVKTFRDNPNEYNYVQVAEICGTYLAVYSCKRAGELFNTKVKNFIDAKNQQLGKQEEALKMCSESEKAMADQHLLMKIVGKRTRNNSVLIPQDMIEACDILVEERKVANICDENKYLFAIAGAKNKHLSPWPLIRKYAGKYDLKDPTTITSTKLRKNLANSMRILNLKENELDGIGNVQL